MHFHYRMLGDVNISAILDSFSVSYDKRVRPNYGGELNVFFFFNFIDSKEKLKLKVLST